MHAASLIHTTQPRRRVTSPAGFTLVEMIAIVIIVGIMAAVAVPSLSSAGASRTGMAAKQIMRDLTFARQRAIATGTVSWVVFDTSGAGSWSIRAENPASPGRAGVTTINDMATGRAYATQLNVNEYVGVSITSCTFDGATEIGFDWLGKPLNISETPLAAVGTVVLAGGRQVTVQPTTGHVRCLP